MIYRLRMVSNEDESFYRDFDIEPGQTFLVLHKAIQEELGYDQMQMASFFTSNEEWEKLTEITLMDMGLGADTKIMEDVLIKDILEDCKGRLLYVFDMLSERAFFIESCFSHKAIKGKTYPTCEKSAGAPPAQMLMDDLSSLGATEFNMDEFDAEFGTEDENGPKFENIDDLDDI